MYENSIKLQRISKLPEQAIGTTKPLAKPHSIATREGFEMHSSLPKYELHPWRRMKTRASDSERSLQPRQLHFE